MLLQKRASRGGGHAPASLRERSPAVAQKAGSTDSTFRGASGVDPRRVLADRLARERVVGSYAGYIVQTIVTLLAVCALAFVVLYGARRLGIGRPRGPIELVGLLPLDARRAIYLVKVAGQVIVVGASEAGLTKLGEIPASNMPPKEKPEPTGFSDVLARVLGREANGSTSVNGGSGGLGGSEKSGSASVNGGSEKDGDA